MEKLPESFSGKSAVRVYFHIDEVAALIDFLSDHYKLKRLEAGGYALSSVAELGNLREKTRVSVIDHMEFEFADNADDPLWLRINPTGVEIGAFKSTPFELGVWTNLKQWLHRHSQSRRFGALFAIIFIGIALLFLGGLSLVMAPWDQTPVGRFLAPYNNLGILLLGAAGTLLVGLISLVRLLNRTKIVLFTQQERPRRISVENWVAIWAAIVAGVIGAVVGSVSTKALDAWFSPPLP